MNVATISLAVGIVGAGLIAGLFAGWAVSIGPGLARVDDRTYVSSMQAINSAILNPAFIGVFMGTVLALGVAAIASFRTGDARRAWWLVAAAVLYALGVVGITVAGNVPLNEELHAFTMEGATDEAITAARTSYEGPWNRLHAIRSVLGVLAVTFASIAALTTDD